ncbi:MAG: DUF4388 domain-containing protein [Chloroflexi bacterium]|nr:MAG: DUF4388 domain-containing protein [Chloroflexota bacterium]
MGAGPGAQRRVPFGGRTGDRRGGAVRRHGVDHRVARAVNSITAISAGTMLLTFDVPCRAQAAASPVRRPGAPREDHVQTQGSLTQTSLASLLETMQSERATGTLSVQHGGESCALYFLFGHLFHAAGDLGQGEEAVIGALGWSDGSFLFDPRAKLPAEETIKTATGELLEEARRRGDGNGSRPDGAAAAAAVNGPGLTATAETAAVAVDAEGPSFEIAAVSQPASPPAAAAVYGNPNAAPLTELYPLPAGKPVYESLKSAFVDFPKLLRTLEADGHTGYVRLDGGDFAGVLLLHDGHVMEALFSGGMIDEGEPAFQQFRRRMDRGEGLVDVVELSGETVVALAQLLTARPLFTGLLARFINFEALLEYLAEEKVDGSLVVTGGTETGVILLRRGEIHGAYTQSQRELRDSASSIAPLAAERTARIEVKAGAGSPVGIDVEGALRKVI